MIDIETILVSFAILGGLVALVFWGWMLVHCLKNEELSTEHRLLWLLVIFCGKFLGAGVYYNLPYRRAAASAA